MKASTFESRAVAIQGFLIDLCKELYQSPEGQMQKVRRIHRTFPLWKGARGSSIGLHLNCGGGVSVQFLHVRDVGNHGVDGKGVVFEDWIDDGNVKSPRCMAGKDMFQFLRERPTIRGKAAGLLAAALDILPS